MSPRYRVTFAQVYEVEADDEQEAIAEAEEQLARDFEQPHIGLFDLMGEPTVELITE